MKDVKLYINNEYVEIGSDTSLPITYQLDDIMNPSLIKNDWSKTISIPSTPTNDKVLHHLYKVDRITDPLNPSTFNVSKKIPFEITINDERFKKGYVKFGNITISRDGSKVYELNLLGELGNFFYDLGQKKMIDLTYPITTTDPVTGLQSNKLGHVINAQFIKDNWLYTTNSSSSIHSYIKYIPMYQGLYEDFDSTLKLSNGVGVDVEPVVIGDELNEWEIGAFYSKKQKPAISIYHTINSILSNMTDYQIDSTLELIGTNYNDSYVTGNILFESDETTLSNKCNFTYSSQNRTFSDPRIRLNFVDNDEPNGLSFQTSGHDQMIFNPVLGQRNMILSFDSDMVVKFYLYENMSSFPYHKFYTHPTETYIFLTNNGSSIQLSTTQTLDGNEINEYTRKNLYLDNTYRLRIPANQTYGILQKNTKGSWSDFTNWNVNDLPINNLRPNVEHYPIRIGAAINGTYYAKDSNGTNIPGHDYLYEDNPSTFFELSNTNVSIGYQIKTTIRTDISSFVDIRNIFKPELTQKDFLLEFCRMYGQYISVKNNVVKIQSRNSYYNTDIQDWNILLDESKNTIVNPISFDKNKIIVGYKENTESEILKLYKDAVGYNYGDAVAITGYEFNKDSIRLLDKNIFNPLAMEQIYLYRYGDTTTPVTSILLPSTYKRNGDKKEFVDNELMFVTYVGTTTLKGPKFGGDDYGSVLLFDDTSKMYKDNKYYYNLNLNNGAMFVNTIPLYSTHKGTSSFDFRRPVSYYFDNVNLYPESDTIYSKYWTKYIEDRYSVNTKIMNAYFNLTDSQVKRLTLGELIYLKGVYWTINKIVDYDLTNYNTTKVELISVNDIENYRSGQSLIAVPVSNTGSVYNNQRNQFQVANSTSQYDGLIYERGLFYSTTPNVDETSTKLLDYSTTLTENILTGNGSPEHSDNSTSSVHTWNSSEGGFFRYTPTAGNTVSLYHFCDHLTKEMSIGTPVSFSFDVRPQADSYIGGYIINMSQSGTLFKTFSVLCLGNVWTRIKVENLTNNVDTLNGLLDIIYAGNPNIYLDVRYMKIEMNTTSSAYTPSPLTPTPIPTGLYNSTIKGLDVNTQYYFRSYIKLGSSNYYFGNILNTTTLNYDLPTVQILDIEAISGTNLVVNSQITYNGGTTVTQCGLVISDSTGPVIEFNVHTTDGFDGNGNYQSTVGDILNYNTLYYFRPYAINSIGVAYGNEWTATTTANPADAPTLSAISISQNFWNNSTFYCTVLTEGTSSVTSRGFEIIGDYINDTYVCGSGTGNYNQTIDGLELNGEYNIKPFAINSSGKIYGDTLTFTNTIIDSQLYFYQVDGSYNWRVYSSFPVVEELTVTLNDCYPPCVIYPGQTESSQTTQNSEFSSVSIVDAYGDSYYNYIY